MPKVSIIIPIYNMEKYLKECLDSVVGQTLKDIEIICVNDGSTDSSAEIAAKYASADSRIKLINKTNSGYGDTMNTGLKQAQGEFIGIVESDDWVEPDMFGVLYNTAKKHDAEVVKSNFFDYYSDNPDCSKFNEVLPPDDYDKILCPIEKQEIFKSMPSIWAAIYKRDFLIQNEINFTTTPGASYQDTSFNFKVWACAKKAYFVKDAYLHYRLDNANASVKNKSKVFCVCDEYKEIEAFLDKNPEKKQSLEELKNYLKYSTYMWNFSRLSGKFQREFVKQMGKEFKEAIKSKKTNKNLFKNRQWAQYNQIASHPIIYWFKYKMQGNI